MLQHRFFLTLCLLMCLSTSALAHSVRPSFLQITLQPDGYYDIVWKVPARGKDALTLYPQLPKHCQDYTTPRHQLVENAVLTQRRIDCGKMGLSGQTIRIEGLQGTIANVLVRVVLNNQQTQTLILQTTRPSFVVTGDLSWQQITADYTKLGIEHILLGVDHLLFVWGLLLLVGGRWALVKTITAFTIAHSITLAASTLGWVQVAQNPVEVVIALSILFLAVELTKKRPFKTLAHRAPWVVAFIFGLLHGFGFAGALREVGLPASDIPLALLTFNVGVELGQLLFVAVVLTIGYSIHRLKYAFPVQLTSIGVYAMGTISAFWLITRTILLF